MFVIAVTSTSLLLQYDIISGKRLPAAAAADRHVKKMRVISWRMSVWPRPGGVTSDRSSSSPASFTSRAAHQRTFPRLTFGLQRLFARAVSSPHTSPRILPLELVSPRKPLERTPRVLVASRELGEEREVAPAASSRSSATL